MITKISQLLKVLSNLLTAIVIVAIVLLVLIQQQHRFHLPGRYLIFSIESGSMAPAIKPGNLVITKSQPAYHINDIITFRATTTHQTPTFITHRVIATQPLDTVTSYTTKGDANQSPDMISTHDGLVQGKVILSLPYLGYIITISQTRLGFIGLILIPGLVIILSELNRLKTQLRGYLQSSPKTKPRLLSRKLILVLLLPLISSIHTTQSQFNSSDLITPNHITTGDWTHPVVTLTNLEANQTITGIFPIFGSILDNQPHHYWLSATDSNGNLVPGFPSTIYHSTSIHHQLLYSWNTTQISDGLYIIKLEARDASGNKKPNQAPVTHDPNDPDDSVHWVTVKVKNLLDTQLSLEYHPLTHHLSFTLYGDDLPLFQQASYQITYPTSEKQEQIIGNFAINLQSSITVDHLYLGTCSQNVCTPHHPTGPLVINLTLSDPFERHLTDQLTLP